MARIRTVKPEFWTSEQIVECSPNARLLFIGMWNFFDDGGNHPVSIKALKLKILPADNFSTAQIHKMVDELIAHKLLFEYVANGARYWHITGWRHQKIEHPTYKFPPPIADDSANIREDSSNARNNSPPDVDVSSLDVEGSIQRAASSQSVTIIPDSSLASAKNASASSTRGTRLPEDFRVTEEHRAWAREHSMPNPDSQIDAFRDYWNAKAGKDASKRDWNATFRNWLRNPLSRSKGYGQSKLVSTTVKDEWFGEDPVSAADGQLADRNRPRS